MKIKGWPGGLSLQAVGLTDQAVASGTNFLSIILVARAVSPSSFGYFVLAFTLLQSAGAVQSALITRPHNVLGAERRGESYVGYTTAAAAVQVAYALLWAAVLLVVSAVAFAVGSPSALLFAIAAPAAIAWQLQEFGRRVLYTEGRLTLALLNDVLSYGTQAALLIWLFAEGTLTGARALAIVAGTSAFAALVLAPRLQRSVGRHIDREAIRTSWRFGRWLGAAELAYWVASQSYIYIGGIVVGPVASAALKSAQTLLGPISVFLAFFVNYLPTSFTRARATGKPEFLRRMRLAFLTTVPAAVVYGLLVTAFAPPLLELVYGHQYRPYATVVRLFALYYVILSISDVFVAALAALGLTRQIFVGHAVGAAISLGSGWLLLSVWGASGGAVGMIISILGAAAVFVRISLSELGRTPQRDGFAGATSAKLVPRR
jgi:O-antigen/teichoic acid export membrane protein